MSEELFDRVQAIQALNGQVQAELEALADLPKRLARLRGLVVELTEYYETRWLADVEAFEKADRLYARHLDTLPEGTYSVLAEDPIFDSLAEFHGFARKVRKASKAV